MGTVGRFETPGRLRDAPEGSPFYDAWHRLVDDLVPTSTRLSGPGAYVDPSERDLGPTVGRAHTWTGFPARS